MLSMSVSRKLMSNSQSMFNVKVWFKICYLLHIVRKSEREHCCLEIFSWWNLKTRKIFIADGILPVSTNFPDDTFLLSNGSLSYNVFILSFIVFKRKVPYCRFFMTSTWRNVSVGLAKLSQRIFTHSCPIVSLSYAVTTIFQDLYPNRMILYYCPKPWDFHFLQWQK